MLIIKNLLIAIAIVILIFILFVITEITIKVIIELLKGKDE